MAKIVKTDTASSEVVHYTFAAGEFDLGGRTKSFETDNPALLSEAIAHPDLSIKVDEVDVEPTFREQLAPEDDPLSAANSVAREEAEEVVPVVAAEKPVPTVVVESDAKSTPEKE